MGQAEYLDSVALRDTGGAGTIILPPSGGHLIQPYKGELVRVNDAGVVAEIGNAQTNNARANLFARRARKFFASIGVDLDTIADATWECEDMARIGSQLNGTGTVAPSTTDNGGVIVATAGTGFAVATPAMVAGVPAAWVKNLKTEKYYAEARVQVTGTPSGSARASMIGLWTGGAAPNSGSLLSFGISPADFTKFVLGMWDTNLSQWNEAISLTATTDIANKHDMAVGCDGLNVYGWLDGVLIVAGSASGFGSAPTAGCAWTITAQNLNGLVTKFDTVYSAVVR